MIRLNDFCRQWDDARADLEQAFQDVLRSGHYILGPRLREFEGTLANRWGRAHACGVASGLDAIEIGLRAMGCKAGERVLTTPLSAFATTLAILRVGAEPVFVDTDRHGLIDLRLCRVFLETHRDIRFFIPVHLYGHCLDMTQLRELRADFSLQILEDCAQSVGASFHGSACGGAGRCVATSFYPTKNLGAIGDGGAILTDDPELDRVARVLRNYGQTAKYRHDIQGWNSRLDELQAALMCQAFLPRLEQWTERRREIAGRYLQLIRNPRVHCLGQPPGSESVWHLFPVLTERAERAGFIQYLKAREVEAGEHYPELIPDQPACAPVRHCSRDRFPVAERISRCEVSLPIHPYLTDSEVEQVITAVNDWSPAAPAEEFRDSDASHALN